MKIVQIIFFGGVGLFIYLVSLFTRLSPADWNGWLGFFGSLLGSIIAILGVYWQATKQNKLSQKQLNNEKESQYRQARPFFLVSQENVNFRNLLIDEFEKKQMMEESDYVTTVMNLDAWGKYNVYLTEDIDSDLVYEQSINYLVIRNVSTKNMYAVRVFVSSAKNNDKKISDNSIQLNDSMNQENSSGNTKSISINKIAANSDAYLLFTNENRHINQVWVWYITEIRESIKLYFKDKDGEHGLEYQSDAKLIGNQKEMEGDYSANYNLARFKESKKLF
ncbi:hypothetical protein [Lactiplantibacillus plantarum]|uniref:hypothetical protein n=1 Tax=Lactiplantibacillus plantarum TaxID=1590 RepID=UPI002237934D|nr:hypothetical protein [Lactiplantibacillus plantarum]MCW6134474.1 hypothetical protein [Lactiplantibacillus plantarum]